MSILDTLVTDRTSDGYYGVEDLNRVAEAMIYVAERLKECGIYVEITPKVSWVATETVPKAAAVKIQQELSIVRNAFAVALPPVPNGVRPWNAEEANNIEKILRVIGVVMDFVLAYPNQIVSGMSYSGNNRRVQALSRGR